MSDNLNFRFGFAYFKGAFLKWKEKGGNEFYLIREKVKKGKTFLWGSDFKDIRTGVKEQFIVKNGEI